MGGFERNNVPYIFQLGYVEAFLGAVRKGGEYEKRYFNEIPRSKVVHLPRNEEAEERKRMERAVVGAGIPKELQGMRIEDVDDRRDISEFSKAQFAVNAYLADIKRHIAEGSGFTILGDPGTGKTMFASFAVVKALEEGQTALMVKARLMFDWLKPGNDPDSYRDLASMALLAIDDLGAEYQSEFTHSELDRLITDRDASSRPTIITSNYREEQFTRAYAPRIIDRVRANNMTFEFVGASFRKTKGAQ